MQSVPPPSYVAGPLGMMKPPILQLALFRDHALDADEHERSRLAMLYLLDALVAVDRLWLQMYPEAPWLYESGVRYVYKDPIEAAAWQDIPNTLDKGFGDCKDFAAWRVAELLERVGVDATPAIQWRLVDGSWRLHALVRLSDGSLEDPSKLLGMGDDRPFRKNVVPLPDVPTEVRGMKAINKAKAILAGLVSPSYDDRAKATRAFRIVEAGAENGNAECLGVLKMVRQGAAAYRNAEALGGAAPRPRAAAAGGKPKPPQRGHAAVVAVKPKMHAIRARVARAKASKGATLRGALTSLLPPGFVNLPGQASPAPVIDMSSAISAVNTAMGQLEAMYQQLLAQDTQWQGIAQQFANLTPLPGQSYQGFVDMANQADQDLQAAAANVSAQIDGLNADLDNLNQQLSNLQQQQQQFQQATADVYAQQQQINAPPPPVYSAPAPSYAPPPADGSQDFGPIDDGGDDSDMNADDMMGYFEEVGEDDTAQKVGAVVQSVAPGVGVFTSLIPGIGPFLAPLTTDATRQAGKLLSDAEKGDKSAKNAIANTAARAKAGDPEAASDMDALARVHKARKAAKGALGVGLSWWPRALYRRALGYDATVH